MHSSLSDRRRFSPDEIAAIEQFIASGRVTRIPRPQPLPGWLTMQRILREQAAVREPRQ